MFFKPSYLDKVMTKKKEIVIGINEKWVAQINILFSVKKY